MGLDPEEMVQDFMDRKMNPIPKDKLKDYVGNTDKFYWVSKFSNGADAIEALMQELDSRAKEYKRRRGSKPNRQQMRSYYTTGNPYSNHVDM